MSYQTEKNARIEKMARIVENYLCELVANASDDQWWELYQSAYDFIEEASINRFSACDKLCALDRRPQD